MRTTKLLLALVLGMLCYSAAPVKADTIVGLPASPGGSALPFGVAWVGEYQQVYTSSAFSGPITITNLEFFNTMYDTGYWNATSMPSGNWAISLSTSAADWNTLSGTYASNLGADNTPVFSGNLTQPWAFGNTLTIILSTPFSYNPLNGNLLMDVFVTSASGTGTPIFFDANASNTVMGHTYNGIVRAGFGLVTRFSTGATNPVPEPASLFLLGTGLAGLARWRRRRT